MKTGLIIGFVISLSLFSFQSNNKKKNDLSKLELNGPVNTYVESSYAIQVLNSGEIIKGQRVAPPMGTELHKFLLFDTKELSDGMIVPYYDKSLKFNEKGFIVEERDYLEFEIKSQLEPSKEIFKYDQQNKLIEKYFLDTKGIISSGYLYKYDMIGDLIECTRYGNKNEQTRYKSMYDKDHNLIEYCIYYSDGGIEKFEYKYNNVGKIVEINKTGKNIAYLLRDDRKETFTYNVNGNLVNKITYDSNGNCEIKETYNYDEACRFHASYLHWKC